MRPIAFPCLAVLGLSSLLQGSAAWAQRIDPAPAFSSDDLTALPRQNWITNGGTTFNQRYSPLDQLTPENVGGLKGVWRTHLRGSGSGPQYSGEAQPIVYDGVIYISTGADDVFALDVETGDILWEYQAGLDPNVTTICCGWTNRGVALGDGKVFIGQLDGKLVALDQRTGMVVWSIQAERWQEGFSITSAPLYYDDMVITGFSGAEYGVRGRVKAYDADDGELIWTFYTIPGPGEVGHDTWPADNEVWMHGGATVWQTPAVDPDLGLLYFSTGNPGPDFNGAVRAGDNLFSASIVAIDVATGDYRWHFQEVHHDIWDYDAPNPVVLFDAQIDGVMRRGLAQVGKTGWVYLLDRVTGEPLIGIDERPVPQLAAQATSPTQPYPRGDAVVPQSVDIPPEGYRLINGGRIFTPFVGDAGVIVAPSLYGGANWPPSSYDPERQALYVCASDYAGNFIGGDRDFEIPPEGAEYHGGVIGFAPLPRSGIFAAMDVTTNTIIWRYRWPNQCYSGSVATAGGLIFTGRNDGRLTALDSDTGFPVWEFQTGAGMNAPATVFEHDGQQYVVAYSAGNVLIGSAHGDSVWLFGLDGELEQTVPNDALLSNVELPSAELLTVDISEGARIYQQTCLPCHGTEGTGGHGGGATLVGLDDVDYIMTLVRDGRNTMPPFAGALSPAEILNVSNYVAATLGAQPAE
ncbi:MAG: PQQ-binding-like beta-propeller repeat protein [Gammaproteobacteria bacterium]|nr:PQQ-binding-like beta-propeller repeat protein [Gammaproteobacteria bacterium]